MGSTEYILYTLYTSGTPFLYVRRCPFASSTYVQRGRTDERTDGRGERRTGRERKKNAGAAAVAAASRERCSPRSDFSPSSSSSQHSCHHSLRDFCRFSSSISLRLCICVFFLFFFFFFPLPFCSGFCLLRLLLVVMVVERDAVRLVKRLLLAI